MNTLFIWRWRDYPGLSGWTPNAIISVLMRGRQRAITDRRGNVREAESESEDVMYTGLEDGGGGHEPLEKAKKQILP